MKTWSERIKDLEARGWTMRMIAEHCGIAYTTVSDIKSKRTTAPIGMAAVLLHALDGKRPPVARKRAA